LTEKKQLAKIYYQSREVRHVEMRFSDFCYRLEIGSATDISGKDEVVTIDYYFTPENNNGDKEKEDNVAYWPIENPLDKVQLKHTQTGVMIEWVSEERIKSSLFFPNERILHIHVDNPAYNYEKTDKEIIER
jgi:hypothetical protein